MTPSLELRSMTFRVRDLARCLEFYRRLGFVVASETPGRAELATEAGAAPIFFLEETKDASTPARDAAGLFHVALLLPSRAALGAWLGKTAEAAVEFDGFSDHGVSEAIYLTDVEGNGWEFYADRPRAAWPYRDGELAMTTEPLRVDDLLAEGVTYPGTTLQGARWGHLHLRVTDLGRSRAFYESALGVSLTQGSYPGAAFLAADGYHHHLGLNTWGHPRRPRANTATGLIDAEFARHGATEARSMTDPDGITLHVTSPR